MIKTKNLSSSLSIVSTAVGSKTLPILNTVLVNSYQNQGILKVTSSNLEMQISTICDAEIDTDDSFCIAYQKISQYAKTSDFIEIKLDGDKAKAKGKSRSIFNIMNHENFPLMDIGFDDGVDINLNSNILASAINETIYAVGQDDVRFYLNGVLLSIENKKLSIVSSDGHRLARLDIDIDCDQQMRCIIPSKSAHSIAKLFPSSDITMTMKSNTLKINDGKTELITKCIDAKYPDFNKVFGVQRPIKISLDSTELYDGISSVSITSDEILKSIEISISDNQLLIRSKNKQGESSDMSIGCSNGGQNISFCVNSQYLQQALQKFSGQVDVELDVNGQSILITGQSTISKHIVMPMRI